MKMSQFYYYFLIINFVSFTSSNIEGNTGYSVFNISECQIFFWLIYFIRNISQF